MPGPKRESQYVDVMERVLEGVRIRRKSAHSTPDSKLDREARSWLDEGRRRSAEVRPGAAHPKRRAAK